MGNNDNCNVARHSLWNNFTIKSLRCLLLTYLLTSTNQFWIKNIECWSKTQVLQYYYDSFAYTNDITI